MVRKNLFIVAICFWCSASVFAVRPFITDDARVVGWRLAQWESWYRHDVYGGQSWHVWAYGPTNRLELTLGAAGGLDRAHVGDAYDFTFAAPLLQVKYLLKPYGHKQLPGAAIVAGTFLPGGQGALVPPAYGAFTFMILSQCFGENEDVLLHANFGVNYLHHTDASVERLIYTWGLGTQIRTLGGFHMVAEFFSGDPYIPGTGTAYQVGFRHFFNDLIQIDGTYGKGVAGDVRMPHWASLGIRLVTTALLPKQKKTFE